MKLSRQEAERLAKVYEIHWKEVMYYVQRNNLDTLNGSTFIDSLYKTMLGQIIQNNRKKDTKLADYYKNKKRFMEDVLYTNQTENG